MILISIFITTSYLLLIGWFAFGFKKVLDFNLEHLPSKTRFSIIIPFRNEAKHLKKLLKSIEALNYPNHLFEIILVDDDSDDDSVNIIKNTLNTFTSSNHITIIPNERKTNSPKKDAITFAITKAKYEWIITTDADCVLPKYWLDSFNEFIQKNNVKCIVAPVAFNTNSTFLNRFQALDFHSLQGATIGGFGINRPFLCNGANFGYEKDLFKTLNGFHGNTQIASGDDIFLLEKITKKHPKQVHYLKCKHAIVKTQPQNSWINLFSQRIRWAAKTSAYNNWFGKLIGITVLLMNALIVSLIIFTLIGSFNIKNLFYIVFIKMIIDFFLIYKSVTFYNQKETLKSFVFAFFIYPFFCTYVAFISIFKGYKWKGRSFQK